MARRNAVTVRDQADRGRARSTRLVAFVGFVMTICGSAVTWAAEPLEPAYIFLIDNSASMRGQSGSDVNRLAVFAARAIVKVLDSKDAATIVPLWVEQSGAAKQLPVALLTSRHRADLLQRLDPARSATCRNGPVSGWSSCAIADYPGQSTPCSNGFDRVIQIVNDYATSMQRVAPGAAGAVHVFFLTDGRCELGTGQPDRFEHELIAKRLKQAAHGLSLDVSLMTFRNNKYTREVDLLAKATGGRHLEVDARKPGTILGPFVEALARARHVPPRPPQTTEGPMVAYPGAEKVYLIGVALANANETMDLEVHDRTTGKKVPLSDVTSEVFRHTEGKNSYRLAIASYSGRDVGKPELRVRGVNNWTVIQLPDYRLRVEAVACAGKCADSNACKNGQTQFEKGQPVCRVVRLLDRQGNVVDEGFGYIQTGLAAATADSAKFASVEQWKGLHPNGLTGARDAGGTLNTFSTELDCSDAVSFTPWVYVKLGGSGEGLFRMGATGQYHCSDSSIIAEPMSLKLKPAIHPGGAGKSSFQLRGNFSNLKLIARARWDHGPKPERSLRLWVGNKPAGAKVTAVADQDIPVELRPSVWCGVGADVDKPIDFGIEITFIGDDRGAPRAKLMLRVQGTWRNGLTLNADEKKPLKWRVAADDVSPSAPLQIVTATPPQDLNWRVRFAPRLGSDFPVEDLHVETLDISTRAWRSLVAGANSSLRRGGGSGGPSHLAATGGQPKPLLLRVRADACCSAREQHFTGDLLIEGAKTRRGKITRVPVEIVITESAWFACYWKWLALVVTAAILIFLAWFIRNIANGVHGLTVDTLSKCLASKVSFKNENLQPSPVPVRRAAWSRKLGPGPARHLLTHVGLLVELGFARKSIWKVVPFVLGDADNPSVKVLTGEWVATTRTASSPKSQLRQNRLFVAPRRRTQSKKGAVLVNDTTPRGEALTVGGAATSKKSSDGPFSGSQTFTPQGASRASAVREWKVDLS